MDQSWIQSRKPTSTQKRRCCQFGGIFKASSILPLNSTVDSKLYCNGLENLKVTLCPERHKVRLLDDNVRLHTAKVTGQKLEDLGWQVLSHPPYSPDLAPF